MVAESLFTDWTVGEIFLVLAEFRPFRTMADSMHKTQSTLRIHTMNLLFHPQRLSRHQSTTASVDETNIQPSEFLLRLPVNLLEVLLPSLLIPFRKPLLSAFKTIRDFFLGLLQYVTLQ